MKFPSELGKQRYCILPARAPYDDRLGLTTLRVLMAIAIHTNSHGIAWPSRIALGKIVGRHVSTVSRHTRKLEELEYLRKLKPRKYPIPRKTNHHWSTARYQVLFEGSKTKLPSKEQFKAAKPIIRAPVDIRRCVRSVPLVRGHGLERVDGRCPIRHTAAHRGDPNPARQVALADFSVADKVCRDVHVVRDDEAPGLRHERHELSEGFV